MSISAKYYEPIQVLNRGFVRLVDTMGDDDAIVEAARASYGGPIKPKHMSRALIRHLMRQRHTGPLEMAEIKLHIRAPLFVARQWMRHRTASINEQSGRYKAFELLDASGALTGIEEVDYDGWHLQSTTNKQGRGELAAVPDRINSTCYQAEAHGAAVKSYHKLIDIGIAREDARTVLPVATMTEWYWKIDLHNLLHFLRLRLDRHAQWQIREYAKVIAEIVREWVPTVWEAFEDYSINAHTFSGAEMKLIRRLAYLASVDRSAPTVAGWRRELADEDDIGTKRERAAFWRALGLLGEQS